MKGLARHACAPSRAHTALAVVLSLSSLFNTAAAATQPAAPGHVLTPRRAPR